MSDWEIRLSDEPSESEKTAASELGYYLERAVLSLRISGDSLVVLHVGDTAFAREHGIRAEEFASENWLIRSVGGDIALVGGGTRGTLYAVYHFLEDHIGVHWWNPSEDFVPVPIDLSLDPIDVSGQPFFSMREICRGTIFSDDGGRFSARNRINRSGYDKLNEAYGGGFDFGPPFFVHTYDSYLPAATWLEAHPEYFSLWNGVRTGGQSLGQLCLTNPAVQEIFWERLLEFVAEGEADAATRRVPSPSIYEISHNDNWRYCQCQNCQEIIERDGHSGLMLGFINPLAERLSEYRPSLFISVLAYYTTAAPPRNVVPRDNVIVRICDTFSNCGASISSEENASYRDLVTQWSEISGNLCIWDYAINYREECVTLPYASEYDYSKVHQFYADSRVRFLFWEHEWPDCADMYDYKIFLEAKYLEDPYRDDFAVLQRTFLDLYYGPAGALLLRYRELLRDAAIRNDAVLAGFGSTRIDFTFIDLDTLLACHQLMDEAAEIASGSALYSKRVVRARLGLDCLVGYALAEHYVHQWNLSRGFEAPFPLDLEEARSRAMSTWREALSGMPENPMADVYIRRTLSGRQDSGCLPVLSSPDWQGRRVQHITREMICCEGAEIHPGTSADDYLVRIDVLDGATTDLNMGVCCVTQGNRDIVQREIPSNATRKDAWREYELTFEFPGKGFYWYFNKDKTDTVPPVTIRLDFLRRLGFSVHHEWTIRFSVKCVTDISGEVGRSSGIYIGAIAIVQ